MTSIDTEAIGAREEMWDVGRRGIGLAAVICVLIFLTVPPIYLFDSFVPLLIGGPLIAIAASTAPSARSVPAATWTRAMTGSTGR